MKRRLLNIVAWGSLVLAIAVVGLSFTAKSRGLHEVLLWHAMKLKLGARDRGEVDPGIQFLLIHEFSSPIYSGYKFPPEGINPSGPLKDWEMSLPRKQYLDAMGFQLSMWPDVVRDLSRQITYAGSGWTLRAPYWAFITAFLTVFGCIKIVPLARKCWKHRSGRRELIEKGLLCGTCGYDLKMTPDRCPECGTVPLSRGAAQ